MTISKFKATDYRRRGRNGFGLSFLLASTMLAGLPVAAAASPGDAAANSGGDAAPVTMPQVETVVVTAEKREENLQSIPASIQAITSASLTQHSVTNFEDYAKLVPGLTFQSLGPNQSIVYIRGVSDGGNGNKSGPLPSVATYLDDQPLTTIGGTLDVHIYDIARIEVLSGPQGTLYGASSESGTLRIITNKPSTDGFSGAIDLQASAADHGGQGYVAEGFVNIPLAQNAAIRLVAFDERDPGIIDNVYGTRPFVTSGVTINNSALVKSNFNPVETYGGRAELEFNVNDNWTIEPSVVYQNTNAPGVSVYNPNVGYLQVNRFQQDTNHDHWVQTAMTIHGKIGRFDLTYSGGLFSRGLSGLSDYTDYSVAYDEVYHSGAYWIDNAGNILPHPQQLIVYNEQFTKENNELRIASPASDRLRFIAGLFQERQTDRFRYNYHIEDFATLYSVTGWPSTIWLTDEDRTDRDEAAFAEVSFDVTPDLTITGGIRGYHYDNSLYGFYGFSGNFSSHTGEAKCIAGLSYRDAPCVNLSKPDSKQTGETHKINLSYKFDDAKLAYFTYSTGFRPGGINRNSSFAPYQADTLDNYEVGWKTSWLDGAMNFNGAVYDEDWSKFQFAFEGPNSLTIIENAPSARILGVEANVDWQVTEHLNLSGGGAYNDAELQRNFCGTDQATGLVIPSCPNSQALALKGQQLAFTPKFKGDLTARYAFDVLNWDAHVQASINYQTERSAAVFISDAQNLGSMPGFATVDFSVGAERDDTSVELFVKNAFDQRGQLSRATYCTTAICGVAYPGVPAAVYVLPAQPLTVGLRVGRKF